MRNAEGGARSASTCGWNARPCMHTRTASTLSLEEQQQLEAAQQQLQEYVLKQPNIDGQDNTNGQLPFARVVEFQSKDK